MESQFAASDLKATGTLARRLFDQCRKSAGPYKLLAGSVKELRNVLEDLEDFLEDPSSPGVFDARLSDRISRSHGLLEQLHISLQSSRSSQDGDANETTVADFKTALDSITKELQPSEDAISSEDISSHLKNNIAAPPSISVGSTSASAPESSHGLRPLSRTSSRQSLVRQDSTRDKALHAGSLAPGGDLMHHRRPSEEKETYVPDHVHLMPSTAIKAAAVRTRSPSLGWNSPFQDPMSISIEEASDMILRDDDASPVIPARPRSRTGPVTSTTAHTFEPYTESKPTAANGLGISVYDQDQIQYEPDPRAKRLRAHSVSGTLTRQVLTTPGTYSATSSHGVDVDNKRTYAYENVSSESLNRVDKDHLSPDAASRSIMKGSLTNSSSSITFSTRSAERSTPSGEAHNSAESLKDQLTAVLQNAFVDSQTLTTVDRQSEPVDHESQHSSSMDRKFTPSPARRPPSPPKKRPRPKIPKRSSTNYRIVNGELPDMSSSSDEEDLYSTSKPTSPIVSTSAGFPSVQHTKEHGNDDEGSSAEVSSVKDSASTISSQRRPRYAEQVLMARAAYVQPIQADTAYSDGSPSLPALKPSTQDSISAVQATHQSPTTLKRYATSTGSQNDSRTAAEQSYETSGQAAAILERVVTMHPQQWPRGGNQDAATAASPSGSPVPVRPIIRGSSGKEMVPEAGIEPGSYVPTDPEIASRSLSVSSKMLNVQTDYKEWYAPREELEIADLSQLDQERIDHIVYFWNGCSWDNAQRYLEYYLTSLIEQDQLDRARRVRHLLGVCLSFKGLWSAAIPLFLSVIRTPIKDIFDLDDGDCAAAYWLGDCYTLLNQRAEALLAYCIAERSSLFRDALTECIISEQVNLRLGVAKADFGALWTRELAAEHPGDPRSILDTRIVSQAAAKSLLESEPHRYWGAGEIYLRLDQNQSRSSAFVSLDGMPRIGKYYNLKLVVANFHPKLKAPWPLMFDPFFTMANVRRGRLLSYECNLIAVFNSNADAKIPKSSPTAIGRMDCFTAIDLKWLIQTIRQSLRTLAMEWSEVANVKGTWFMVRYSFMQTRIATTHYFSIALFRQSLRAGYGVDICPDGICSSRIMKADWEHLNGVHNSESKRIKKLIRDLLDEAAKQEAPTTKKETPILRPEAKRAGKGVMGKSLAVFRQKKRSDEGGATA